MMVYIHTDHLNTPKVVTDQSQTVVWKGDYKPFGEATETVSAIDMPLRYPGQIADEETGLSYNYFRSYNPVTGRYAQSDPIGLEGGINSYLYANANPNLYFDPYGHSTFRMALPWAVGAAAADGPVPIGDLLALGILGGALLYDACTESVDEREQRCEEWLEIDMAVCDAISNAEHSGKRPPGTAARCRSSAMQRYGNCLADRDRGPLDTWNN